MIKILEAFKPNTFDKNHRESGAAMIFAIILLIMLVSVSVFVASAALTQSNVTKSNTIRTALLQGSDNGIAWAMGVVNANRPLNGVTPAIDGIPASNPYVSTTGGAPVTINGVTDVVWKVWTEKVVSDNNVLSYYVYSKAYSLELGEDKSITQRAIVEATAISSSSAEKDADGNPVMSYRLDSIGAMSQGIFTNVRMNVNGNSKVYSYNSLREGSYPSGTAKSTVSTNGTVQIAAADNGIQRIIGSAEGSSTGCQPTTICSQANAPAVSYRDANMGFTTSTMKNSNCPNDSYENWVSSQEGGTLVGNANSVLCVGDLVFDTNTIVSGAYTPTKPLTVIVLGSVTVLNGADVNWGLSPTRLRIIGVGGGNLTINKASNPETSFLFASEGSTCTIGVNNGTGTATHFGSLACGTLTLEAGNKIFIDTASYSLSNGGAATNKIWFKVYQEELEDRT